MADSGRTNAPSAAEAIVDALIEEGVTHVFGVTGDTVLPILDAIYHRQDRIKYITARFETGATAMADGYSRVTGRIGCCLFHVGPSIANTVLGVWAAHKDAVPLLVMSANLDTFRLNRNLWHEFDVMGVMSRVTKWSDQLIEPKDVPRLMRTAFQAAKSGMPGPVHLDFPKDLLPKPVGVQTNDVSMRGGAHCGSLANAPRPEAWAVEETARRMQAASRPVILAGRGVRWAGAGVALTTLAERLAAPVITTEMGRGAIPEDHRLAGGIAGHFGHSTANTLLREADLVLGLGARFLNVNTINWSLISEKAQIIQVENDPIEIGRQYAVALGIHADSGSFLADLVAWCAAGDIAATAAAAQARAARVAELRADQDRRYYDTDLDAVPIKPQRITRAIAEACDADALYVIGAGLHTQFAHALHVRQPDQYQWAAGSGTMAWAFPAALGAKLARPDRQVVVLVGDGDFGMNAQEIETSVRENLPVIAVVYNDCSYGALRVFQNAVYGARYLGSHYGETDLVKLAEAYGARGERIDDPGDLAGALKRAAAAEVTSVIDVRIDGWEDHYRAAEWAEFHRF